MEAYLHEWVALLLRWAHVVTAIAWIGASFYFIWLDNHLQPPAAPGDDSGGIGGELWAVHGGGIYHAEKFRLGPPVLPPKLHWFMWEAYWTWITGFALLVVVYYSQPLVYLVDPAVRVLSGPQAIGIGLASIVLGTAIYEGLCRSPLGRREVALAGAVVAFVALSAWALFQLLGGRAAFIHLGAMLGTIMVANVAHVIIPGQRKLVAAIAAGTPPDPALAAMGKQRSVHNTYFTLPVVFAMLSGHSAMTWSRSWSWLVFLALALAGALIRTWFVQRHRGGANPLVLAAGLALIGAAAAALTPRDPAPAATAEPPVRFSEVQEIVGRRCLSCHAAKPTQTGFSEPPKGFLLDSPERIRTGAERMRQQSALIRAMPPGNLTAMTDEERQLIDRWVREGVRTD